MPKTKKDLKETENPVKTEIKNGTAEGLKDGELENVSGGLGGITIYDYCTNSLDKFYCFEAFWGQCPRLIIDEKRLFFELNPSYGYIYTVSCSKGCFSKERLNSDIDR